MCKCVCVCGLNYLTKISGHKCHPNCKSTDLNTKSFGQVLVTVVKN